MSYQEIIIVLVFSIWLMVSICYALFNNRIAAATYRVDVFRLLSAFQLFSRKINQVNLSYRDLLPDQSTTPWAETSLNYRWRLYQAIWFPQNMAIGFVKSIMDDLMRIIYNINPETSKKKISDRFVYHAIFQFLKRYPPGEGSIGRQFRISDCESRELFVSDFYKK
jgi:hypothetical protein